MIEVEQQPSSTARSRGLLAAFFVASGVNHFVAPRPYRSIVPPRLNEHAAKLVEVSGVAEVLGGLGVLLRARAGLPGSG